MNNIIFICCGGSVCLANMVGSQTSRNNIYLTQMTERVIKSRIVRVYGDNSEAGGAA